MKRNNSKVEIEKEVSKEIDNTTTSTTTTTMPTTTTSTSTTAKTTTTKATTSPTTTKRAIKEGTTSKGYKIEYKNGAYYIDGILVANKSYPLDKEYIPSGTTYSWVRVDTQPSDYAKATEYNWAGYRKIED